MQTAIVIVLFIIGIVLIVKGGDYFVDAAAWIAEVSGIPKFIIGATIVSVATTLPELIVSAIAAVEGKVDMAVGNAVGSVTANTGLILGIAAIFIPCVIVRKTYLFKSALLVVSCAALLFFSYDGQLTTIEALVLLVLFLVFVVENVRSAKTYMGANETDKLAFTKKSMSVNVIKFIIGAAGIVVGARLLVDNGSEIARFLGVPERIIAVTMISIGTSLPELVTTVTSIIKKQSALSLGNIIGANIIDITAILSVCTFLTGKPLPISAQGISLDIPVCLAVLCAAVIPMLLRSKLMRWQGAALLVGYAAYVIAVVF